MAGIYYTKGYPPPPDGAAPFVYGDDLTTLNNISFSTSGKHDVYIWLVDKANNWNHQNASKITLYYDGEQPMAPINLTVTPDGWTNKNSFTVDWTDPADISGVKQGAYYFIGDERPESQSDGSWTSNKPFTLTDVPEGIYNIYVWLEDIVGNTHHKTYSTDEMRLDMSDPADLSIIINENDEYTNNPVVDLKLDGHDNVSGIDSMSFSFNKIDFTDPELFFIEKTIELPEGDGKRTITYKVEDKAGNIATASDSIILDTKPPQSLDISINGGAEETNSTKVNLFLKAEDVTSGIHQMSFSEDGKTWSDWEDFKDVISYTVSEGDGGKTIYFRVNDKAGNIAEPASTSIILNTSKPEEPVQDRDGDGYYDDIDVFPDNPEEWLDTDSDSVGDNSDAFPSDPLESKDTDSDGVGDNSDAFPNDKLESKDTDSDGVGDNSDAFPDDPTRWEKKMIEPDKKTPDDKEDNVGLIAGVIVVIVVIIILLFFFLIKPKIGAKTEPEEPEKKGPEMAEDNELKSDNAIDNQQSSQNVNNIPVTQQQPQQQDQQRYPPSQ
jgi:hypothetical protein